MAFAALDYFFAGMPIPSERTEDFPGGVPPDGHPLADYIYRRLLDSFLQPSAVNFVSWTLHSDHPTWFFKGVTRWTTEDEFPRLQAFLDQGQPVPLGLVSSRTLAEIGGNHQVVAYGYELDGTGEIRVYVYDNNHRDIEVVLATGPGSPHVTASTGEVWRGFFVQGYTAVRPTYETQPPPERDSQFVSQSVPTSMVAGQTHPVSVTMRNTGRVAWTREEGFYLGSQNPQDNENWGVGRVAVPGPISPGAAATFDFTATAPRTSGQLNFQWRLLQESVEWFGESTPNLVIAVGVPEACREIEQDINLLEEQVRRLQVELKSGPPSERPRILEEIRELRSQIEAKRRDLEQCLAA